MRAAADQAGAAFAACVRVDRSRRRVRDCARWRPSAAQKHFGQIVPPDVDKFTALHYAFFNTGAVIVVPRGTRRRGADLGHVRASCGAGRWSHTLVLVDDEAEAQRRRRLLGRRRRWPAASSSRCSAPTPHLRYVQLAALGARDVELLDAARAPRRRTRRCAR